MNLLNYSMIFNHAGIMNEREEDARRFYGDFLGLRITKEYVVPAELSEQIFSLSRDIRMLVFEKGGVKIEVFIAPDYSPSSPRITHIGLLLDDLAGLLERAGRAGVQHIAGKTADKTVHFIRDFSGNLIEIKQM